MKLMRRLSAFVNLAKEHGMKHLIARSIGAGRARTNRHFAFDPQNRARAGENLWLRCQKSGWEGQCRVQGPAVQLQQYRYFIKWRCDQLHSDAVRGGYRWKYFSGFCKDNMVWRENQNVRNTHVDTIPVCKDCEQRYLCGGGCMAAGFNENGSLCNPYPSCALNKIWCRNIGETKGNINPIWAIVELAADTRNDFYALQGAILNV